jgi:putative methionine-R-sulfoxide reductase with GAF domain
VIAPNQEPVHPARERDRHRRKGEGLTSLQRWELVEARCDLDAISELAASVCSSPIGFVTLVGEGLVRVMASTDLPQQPSPCGGALCTHVVENEAELVVTDVREDERFAAQLGRVRRELVAFAGVPLIGRDGLPLGVLAVGDLEPHAFSRGDVRALNVLARGLVAQVELEVKDLSHSQDIQSGRLPGRVRRLSQALDTDDRMMRCTRGLDLETGEQPAPIVALAGLPPLARGLVLSLQLEGASFHSIAAALNQAGYFPGPGRRWHWRKIAAICGPQAQSA